MRALAVILFSCCAVHAGIIEDTRAAINSGNFALGEALVQQYSRVRGNSPELAQAASWLARGALAAKNLDRADAYASEARQLSVQLMAGRPLDADPLLPLALGNAIEVHAQVLNARGGAAGAVAYLRSEARTYGKTSLAERIQKNINILTMEGKPAPPLDAKEWLGAKPASLASLKGKPVLLFFWAHWCPDCKSEIPILAKVMAAYKAKGLVLVSPTRYYGYTAEEENAPPAVEKPYIEKIRQQYYAPLGDMIAPLSNANFVTYGCSSTPTLVLLDRQGIVRWYHPGKASEEELVARIQPVL
jgi:thiol-disulfide isomerase/thioredoxin